MRVKSDEQILMLPATPELRRQAYWNLLFASVLVIGAMFLYFSAQMTIALIAASAIVCFQPWHFLRAIKGGYVAIREGKLEVLLPPYVNSMNLAEVGSVQFVPGSGTGWFRSPDRYVVRHNRYERLLDIPVRSAAHRALIEPFLRQHLSNHMG